MAFIPQDVWPTVYGKKDRLLNNTWPIRRGIGKAMVFLRSTAVGGLGHVGWAFEVADGQYCFGGTENVQQMGLGGLDQAHASFHQGTSSQGGDNQAWNLIRYDDLMFRVMGKELRYDKYKVVLVSNPSPAKAYKACLYNLDCGFTGISNNCLDATHRVVTGYGANGMPAPWMPTNWAPAWYFAHMKGTQVNTPGF